MQIFTEIAVSIGDIEKGMQSLARAVDLGLYDRTWIDACPVLDTVRSRPEFPELRRRVVELASRILAAYRTAKH
jgi:hypothetical protein